MASYTYRSLHERHVRLLELLPGRRGKVQCNLRHVSLDDDVVYEALSYCWGSSTTQVTITVDEQMFLVTQNLHAALLRLRDTEKSRTLWIDAICINQNSVPEKNIQVPLMRDVYKLCQRVVVWLGEHDFYTEFALKAIKYMASNQGDDQYNYYDWRQLERSQKSGTRASVTAHLARNPERLFSALAFNSLFTRPWFTRVWVLQEIALSPRAIVVCGAYQLDWDLVESASAMSRTNFEVQNHLGTILQFRNWPSDFPDDILCRMIAAWHKDSTNPRDKIYGLTGLFSSQDNQFSVEIDYGAQVDQVYANFTRNYLSQTGNLQVLALCRGCKFSEVIETSSWVIDSEYNRHQQPLPDQIISWLYRASDGRICGLKAGGPPTSFTPGFSSDGRILGLQGFQADVVVSMSVTNEPATNQQGESNLGNLVGAWLSGINFCRFYLEAKAMIENADPCAFYKSRGQSMLEAFWYTIYGHDPCKTDETTHTNGKRECEEFDKVLTHHVGRLSAGMPSALIPVAKIHLALVVLRGLLGQTAYLRFFGRIGITKQRRLFLTENGHVGLGPRETSVNDKIVIIKSHRAPMVARWDKCWKIVGECYVHGMMQGEIYDETRCGSLLFS